MNACWSTYGCQRVFFWDRCRKSTVRLITFEMHRSRQFQKESSFFPRMWHKNLHSLEFQFWRDFAGHKMESRHNDIVNTGIAFSIGCKLASLPFCKNWHLVRCSTADLYVAIKLHKIVASSTRSLINTTIIASFVMQAPSVTPQTTAVSARIGVDVWLSRFRTARCRISYPRRMSRCILEWRDYTHRASHLNTVTDRLRWHV